MKCLRCGYNCIAMDMPILCVEGETLNVRHKLSGQRCPNLSFNGITAVCLIHNHPAYKNSCCESYGDPLRDPSAIGTEDINCPMGTQILASGGFTPPPPVNAEDVQLIGLLDEYSDLIYPK